MRGIVGSPRAVSEHEIVRRFLRAAAQVAGHDVRQRMEPVGGGGELGDEQRAEVAPGHVRELVQEDDAKPLARPRARRLRQHEHGTEEIRGHRHQGLRGEEDGDPAFQPELRRDVRREGVEVGIRGKAGIPDDRPGPAESQGQRGERHEAAEEPQERRDLHDVEIERRPDPRPGWCGGGLLERGHLHADPAGKARQRVRRAGPVGNRGARPGQRPFGRGKHGDLPARQDEPEDRHGQHEGETEERDEMAARRRGAHEKPEGEGRREEKERGLDEGGGQERVHVSGPPCGRRR